MAVKTEKDLSENARNLWLKAFSAVELRNHGYAISLLQAVLKEAPEFLEGRKMLRRAEIAANKGKKSFLSGLSTASLKGSGAVKKDPLGAIEMAEKSLESDPYSASGNRLLRDAALAAGLPEIAEFAMETLVEGNPNDTKILHELGSLYYEHGKSEQAVETYNRISAINPADLIAIKRGKDAAAQASMKHGGWEQVAESGGALDYRSLIKDKDLAVSLEQQSRVVKSDEMIDQQISELYARAEEEPGNVDVARKIAQLFEQKGEIESAIWWYTQASELTKNTDPVLVRKVSDLNMKLLDNKLAEFDQWLAEYGETPEAPQVREQLEDLKKQKAALQIQEARKRVERNPTDLQFRFELGEKLLESGNFTDAIPELQKARQSPNVRLKAMNLLGQCYVGKHMLDLAKNTFASAASEIAGMDDTKKDILYKLGLVHEGLGEQTQYLECMKQIYEVDYGYRDVAKRVEESYGG
jgi:tetratricopeptide (TPR) repeat protein